MKITINTDDVTEIRTTPRGAGLEASIHVVRYRSMWPVNGRATHSVADTATLILAVLHAMNEAEFASEG
jgi:hypothetical protein